jgi:hypothetical protein
MLYGILADTYNTNKEGVVVVDDDMRKDNHTI